MTEKTKGAEIVGGVWFSRSNLADAIDAAIAKARDEGWNEGWNARGATAKMEQVEARTAASALTAAERELVEAVVAYHAVPPGLSEFSAGNNVGLWNRMARAAKALHALRNQPPPKPKSALEEFRLWLEERDFAVPIEVLAKLDELAAKEKMP